MFVNPISNYILIVRSSWSSVISGRLSWAASNKFVGTVECRPHRQSRAAVWPINISHYAAATMMVIKEEKNWSPILDLDMMKHVVSSTWLTLTRRLLTFLVWQSSFNSEKQFSWHLFVLQKSCVIYLRQFQAIFTKSKIKPCITFDPAKKPNSARNRTVHILFDKIFLSLTNPELGVVQMVIYLSVGLGFYWMFYGLFNSFLILFIIYLYPFQLFNQNKVNKLEINFNWPSGEGRGGWSVWCDDSLWTVPVSARPRRGRRGRRPAGGAGTPSSGRWDTQTLTHSHYILINNQSYQLLF